MKKLRDALIKYVAYILHSGPDSAVLIDWFNSNENLPVTKEWEATIKGLMKKAFDEGFKQGYYDASHIDWDRSEGPKKPKFKNFKTWFNTKYN